MGLLELDLALASPIVDVLLGGVGRAWPTRELTDIEEAILTSVVQMAVQELNLAWQSVGLEFVFEKRETEAAVARMLTAGEKTLCVSFEARMPEAQGAMNLCLPAVVLNAILRRLISEGDRPQEAIEGGAGENAGADGRGEDGRCAAVSCDAAASE